MKRTTDFVVSAVDATPDCPVLFVKIEPDEIIREGFLSLARLDDVERLKAEVGQEVRAAVQQQMAEAMPFLHELAKAHISWLDERDVVIKVSPGRAAWVISRARVFLEQLDARTEAGDVGEANGG